jgi:GNAT superfamily N-acetyltransferase
MSVFSHPKLIRLDSNTVKRPFRCKDADLNDFFENDALKNSEERVSVTYIMELENKMIAYFSLLHDKVSLDKIEPKWRNRFNRALPNPKRTNNYPAVKIGRLAVSEDFENQGVGTLILNFVKQMFSETPKAGCRYLTVDAYATPAVLAFYEKNGFEYLIGEDNNINTRLMYYDLKKFAMD